MGIKADFYVGIGPEAEWLGSIFKNGDIWHIPLNILIQVNQIMFEELTLDFLKEHDSVIADRGDKWDHPWADSRLTDYSYIFDPNLEKVLVYHSGIDYLSDPLKVLQGYPMDECKELYGTPKFPTMRPDQLMKTEELLKKYGCSLTEPL
jgi:hypothetical protein